MAASSRIPGTLAQMFDGKKVEDPKVRENLHRLLVSLLRGRSGAQKRPRVGSKLLNDDKKALLYNLLGAFPPATDIAGLRD